MKIHLLSLLFLFTFTVSYSQQTPDIDNLIKSWPADQLRMAKVSDEAQFMTQQETDVVFICNLVRLNGPLFVTTILEPYLDARNIKTDRYVKTLIKTLEQQKNLPVFHTDKLLYQLAYSHAKTSGQRGTTGHNGFDDRFMKAKKDYRTFAENCYYGEDSALVIVLELLIDRGESDLGHRKNILHRELDYLGVSIQPHRSVYKYNCVMEFGGTRFGSIHSGDHFVITLPN